MGIEWFRDLSITMFGFVAVIVFVFFAVLAYFAYRDVKGAATSVKAASKSVQDTVDTVRKDVVTPLINLTNLIQWVKAFIDGFVKSFHKADPEGGSKNVGQ